MFDFTLQGQIPDMPNMEAILEKRKADNTEIIKARMQIMVVRKILISLEFQVKLGSIDAQLLMFTKAEEKYADSVYDTTGMVILSLWGRKYTAYHDFFPDCAYRSKYNYRYHIASKRYILSIHNHKRKVFMQRCK